MVTFSTALRASYQYNFVGAVRMIVVEDEPAGPFVEGLLPEAYRADSLITVSDARQFLRS